MGTGNRQNDPPAEAEPVSRDELINKVLAHRGAPALIRPTAFPPGIDIKISTYINWSLAITDLLIWIATPKNADEVVTIANWASTHNYKIRALGHSHNWSPLVVPGGASVLSNVLLVDTSRLTGSTFNPDASNPSATFGVGVTVQDATAFLQSQDNHGQGGAPGYSFLNMTGPGDLSIGGVLAIGAHGTGVPFEGTEEPKLNGCLSNLILSFKAVVTDPNGPNTDKYVLKEFSRSNADSSAFLVHLGRAFLTEVTLRVVPNYYLQVRNWYPDASVLFQPSTAAPSDQSLSSFVDKYGRIEVIWFPFTNKPWVKTWQRMDEKIEPQVSGPYNYPWTEISVFMSEAIKAGLFLEPSITPLFGAGELLTAELKAPPSLVMNGTSRDLLLYVPTNTLRVTACGYAIQVTRQEVQQAANDFYVQYTSMLASYQDKGQFPVNGPVELRFTTIDYVDDLGVSGAKPPSIAATRPIDPSNQALDTVFWVDSLTMPGTPNSDQFYSEFEAWLISKWGKSAIRLRPEWSKGWAYTSDQGAWTNSEIITTEIPLEYNQPDQFDWTKRTLAKYDKSNIYTNTLLNSLLPG